MNAGVHVTVAAGIDGSDAGYISPALVPAVITVGGTSIYDGCSSWLNFRSAIDIFAPGLNIISAWIRSPTATNNLLGTSMVSAVRMPCRLHVHPSYLHSASRFIVFK